MMKPTEKISENPITKPAESPPVTKSTMNITKTTPVPAPTKAKTAKEMRADKKKGKNKVDAGQQQQPSDPLETMIDKMVSSGNAEGAMDQMAGAWR